jgi:hypothetical protein
MACTNRHYLPEYVWHIWMGLILLQGRILKLSIPSFEMKKILGSSFCYQNALPKPYFGLLFSGLCFIFNCLPWSDPNTTYKRKDYEPYFDFLTLTGP